MSQTLKQICKNSSCNQEKSLDEFHHDSTNPNYHDSICKECREKDVNFTPKKLQKKCTGTGCGKTKSLDEFHHNRTKSDYHNDICKECQSEVDKNNRELKK